MRFSASRFSVHPLGRTNRRGVAIAAAAAICVAAGVTGCNGSGGVAGGSGQITVAAAPGVSNAPLYLAASQGMFAKAGLKVTIENASSDTASLHALTTGTADVAAADYADFFYVQANVDPNLEVVTDGYDAAPNVMEVLSLPSSNITAPQQLIGKTIGTPEPEEFPYAASAPYSLETLAAQSVLLNDGVQPTQVTWKPIPAQNLVGALKSHQVQAILADEPQIFQAESQLGATEVIDALSGSTANLPLDGYFTRSSFAHSDAGALHTFQSVLLQAQAEAAVGKGVRTVLSQAPSMDKLTAAMVTLGVYPTSLNVDGIQQVADLMFNFSMLAEPVTVSSITFY
jgi:NitT/TauT family transport system substrate-binding protein